MVDASPKTIAKIIDEIERIREDLLVIQRALEKRKPPRFKGPTPMGAPLVD